MADAIDSGVCSLIGLGRSVVLQPDLPVTVLLNPSISDDEALAVPHIVKGQWFANMMVRTFRNFSSLFGSKSGVHTILLEQTAPVLIQDVSSLGRNAMLWWR